MKMEVARRILKRMSLRQFYSVANELKQIGQTNQIPLKVLDIGCGDGWYWKSEPLCNLIKERIIVLYILDAAPVPASLKEIATIYKGVAPAALSDFEEDSFDFIVTYDLIEHFSKEDGYRLLYEIDRVSKFGSSIFTPNGFVWQPPSLNNTFNAHLSGWTPRELHKIGWDKQRSAGGLKMLHGAYGQNKVDTKYKLAVVIMAALDAFSMLHPRLSFAFVAISRKKQPRENFQSLAT